METTEYSYDLFGNVETTLFPDTTTEVYEYDAYGRFMSRKAPDGGYSEVKQRNKRAWSRGRSLTPTTAPPACGTTCPSTGTATNWP